MTSQLRPIAEIEHAHGVLREVFLNPDLRKKLDDDKIEVLAFMGSVLCWVCQHDHQSLFEDTLLVLEDWLKREGVEVKVA